MIGLRTFLKDFADSTKLVPFDKLYERQRELVRCDFLRATKGRGPGSGVPLSPANLAIFLVSVLASDKLSDLGDRTSELYLAKPVIRGAKGTFRVPRDLDSTFGVAVTQALLHRPIAGLVTKQPRYVGIQATRPWRGVIMRERPTKRPGKIDLEFFVDPSKNELPPEVKPTFPTETVSIEGEVFQWLCRRMWDYLEQDFPVKRPRILTKEAET